MTYSIVAKENETYAVATVTASICVGGFVPHAFCDVGAIATQGYYTNILYADKIKHAIQMGSTAEDAINKAILADINREYRQLIVVDKMGNTAAHTGCKNEGYAEAICQRNVAVAGNRLQSNRVLEDMLDGYFCAEGNLVDRLILALESGLKAGGDKKGAVSTAIKVVNANKSPIDLRIDSTQRHLLIDELRDLYQKYCHIDFQSFINAIPTKSAYSKAGNDP
ncbi:DUF1028 domain-containing protein [Cysteiniphilum sp. 6C5]|uniref:DUF1028 domain-containing protein n=1 Tax=unclassified Cysteiniphilum TaxID=2610889 RepID=UPI003F825140